MPGRRNVFSTLRNKVESQVSKFFYEQRGTGYGSGAYMDDEPPYEAKEAPRRTRRSGQKRGGQAPQVSQAWQQQQQPYPGMEQPMEQAPYAQQYAPQQPQPQQPREQQPISQFTAQVAEQQSRSKQQPNAQILQFPGAYAGAQEPAPQPQYGICVLNLRSNQECRLAITMLRQGDAVMVIMESVSDPAEMRRYVDTLSGACFSLNATITKISRHGTYLLAPGTVNVKADSVTSQMNSIQRRAAAPQQRRQANPYAPEAAPYPPSYQNPAPGGFEYRAPAAEPQQPAFYSPQPQEAPPIPSFNYQQPGSGYVPDQMEAVN